MEAPLDPLQEKVAKEWLNLVGFLMSAVETEKKSAMPSMDLKDLANSKGIFYIDFMICYFLNFYS